MPFQHQHKDRYLYMIHLVGRVQLQSENVNHWQHFASVYLNKIFGRYSEKQKDGSKKIMYHKKDIINYFVDAGVMETNNSYSTGYQGNAPMTKGYKITKKYLAVKWKIHELTDVKFLNKLQKYFDSLEKNNDSLVLNHTRKVLEELNFDVKKARQFIDDNYSDYSTMKKAIQNNKRRFNIDSLRGSKHVSRSKVVDRLYSPITQCARDLRQFLTHKGDPLYEIDIKCSHPYHLILMSKILNGELECDTPQMEELKKLMNWEESMFCKRNNNIGISEYYIDMITDGDIYNEILKAARNTIGCDYSRKKIKKTLLMHFNIRPNSLVDFIYGKELRHGVINGLFPEIERFLIAADCGSHLGTIISKFEACFIIDTILKDCAIGEFPVLTIHDSFLTTQKVIWKVRTLIDSAYEFSPIKPQVSIKRVTRN